MDAGISAVANNLGMSFEWIVFIILFFMCLIFFAADFKVGLIVLFFLNGAVFAWMKYLSEISGSTYNYVPFLIMTFISLVLMSLSLYFVEKGVTRGNVI